MLQVMVDARARDTKIKEEKGASTGLNGCVKIYAAAASHELRSWLRAKLSSGRGKMCMSNT